ncbi:MAG TPA: AAA family ATPase, partial [Planctomycetaceae bacterium]|nr:AAA family ATPase [Planctomycetaceae bacterium]
MKITGIDIERFGAWRGFSQTLHPQGLNVIYGPNEAGKTTLLRFIRGVLYGFPPDDNPLHRRARANESRSGSLQLTHGHQTYGIHRIARGDDPGLLTISGAEPGDSPTRLLSELVAGTDEQLFQSVFAVGLPELQEFATLAEDQVARHLYGMTLGPQGQVLMELPRRMDAELERLWPKEGQRGTIDHLFEKHRELTQQVQGSRPQWDRYRTLVRQRGELERHIAALKIRHTDLQRLIRGHQYLEKVHPPWQRVRDHRRELAAIPDLRSFPTDGLSRLDRLETDRDSALRMRDDLLRDLREISQQLRSNVGDDGIRRFAGTIRSLGEQKSQWDELRGHMVELEQQAARHERELADTVTQIGPRWSLSRLETVVDTPEGQGRFVTAAMNFQQVRSQTRRRQRRYRRVSQTCRDRELALRTELMHLGVEDTAFEQPLEVARQRLAQLAELGKLQLQAAELQQRTESIHEQIERLRERLGLPDWVWLILGFFVIAGAGLFAAGLSAGVTTGWLVGLIYVALALTAGGTTWALKLQFEDEIQDQVAELRNQRNEYDTRRFDIEKQIRTLVEQLGLRELINDKGLIADATDGRLISLAADRLAQLELAQREYQRILDTRKRLSLVRGRLQGHQREMGVARKGWCDTLKSLGYDETVDVKAAFTQWQSVTAARELRRRGADARRELRGLREDWDRFRQKVEDLGLRMKSEGIDYQQPFAAIQKWEAELRDWIRSRQEYKRLVRDRKTRRAEADDYQRRVDGFQQQIAALLQQANATDRADLERKLQLFQRRQQVVALLEQAERDLEMIARTEPELAIVEEDLARFRPEANGEILRRTMRESADAENQLQELFEQLGTIKQELKALSADRLACRTRLELQQTSEKLHDAWEGWYATAMSAETVDLVSALFEQAHQ